MKFHPSEKGDAEGGGRSSSEVSQTSRRETPSVPVSEEKKKDREKKDSDRPVNPKAPSITVGTPKAKVGASPERRVKLKPRSHR